VSTVLYYYIGSVSNKFLNSAGVLAVEESAVRRAYLEEFPEVFGHPTVHSNWNPAI